MYCVFRLCQINYYLTIPYSSYLYPLFGIVSNAHYEIHCPMLALLLNDLNKVLLLFTVNSLVFF